MTESERDLHAQTLTQEMMDHHLDSMKKFDSLKTEKTQVGPYIAGGIEEEKKMEAPLRDKLYSERETTKAVKRNMLMDQSHSKGMNEDIPIDLTEPKRTGKRSKSKRRNLNNITGLSQDGMVSSHFDYSSMEKGKPVSPKKKY